MQTTLRLRSVYSEGIVDYKTSPLPDGSLEELREELRTLLDKAAFQLLDVCPEHLQHQLLKTLRARLRRRANGSAGVKHPSRYLSGLVYRRMTQEPEWWAETTDDEVCLARMVELAQEQRLSTATVDLLQTKCTPPQALGLVRVLALRNQGTFQSPVRESNTFLQREVAKLEQFRREHPAELPVDADSYASRHEWYTPSMGSPLPGQQVYTTPQATGCEPGGVSHATPKLHMQAGSMRSPRTSRGPDAPGKWVRADHAAQRSRRSYAEGESKTWAGATGSPMPTSHAEQPESPVASTTTTTVRKQTQPTVIAATVTAEPPAVPAGLTTSSTTSTPRAAVAGPTGTTTTMAQPARLSVQDFPSAAAAQWLTVGRPSITCAPASEAAATAALVLATGGPAALLKHLRSLDVDCHMTQSMLAGHTVMTFAVAHGASAADIEKLASALGPVSLTAPDSRGWRPVAYAAYSVFSGLSGSQSPMCLNNGQVLCALLKSGADVEWLQKGLWPAESGLVLGGH